MALDEATARAVRDLWEVGARCGRSPSPTPEADPWEEDDDAVRTYEAPILLTTGTGPWSSSLPLVEEPRPPRRGR